jgi:hypothetical protein
MCAVTYSVHPKLDGSCSNWQVTDDILYIVYAFISKLHTSGCPLYKIQTLISVAYVELCSERGFSQKLVCFAGSSVVSSCYCVEC